MSDVSAVSGHWLSAADARASALCAACARPALICSACAAACLACSACSLVVVTAVAGDEEMQQRIERHRLDRPQGFSVVECADDLGEVLRRQSAVHRMVLVDCLTLWVSQLLMPCEVACSQPVSDRWPELRAKLLDALPVMDGPVVLVS